MPYPFRLLLGCCLALATALSATAAESASEKLQVQLGFPASLPLAGNGARTLTERLERLSEGGLSLELREPESGAAIAAIPAAVGKGRLQAAYTWLGREPGAVSAAQLFDAVPFGPGPKVFMAWYYEGPGQDMLQSVHANQGLDLNALLCGLGDGESAGWFASPVESVADLEGLKARFGGLGGEVLKRLGVELTTVPADELLAAAEAGRVQATELAHPAIDRHTGIHQLLPYNLHPGWQQPFTAQYLLVNGKRWRALSRQHQAMLRTTCEAVTARTLARSALTHGQALSELQKAGAQIRQLPTEVLQALRRATETVLDAHAQRNPQFARILESQREFQRQHARTAASNGEQ